MNASALRNLLRNRLGLTEPELADLQAESATTGSTIEGLVLDRGLVKDRPELYDLLARELNVPYIDISTYDIEPGLLLRIPADVARRLHVLPLFEVAGTLTVAMANPTDINALDELRRALHAEVNPVLTDPQALQRAVAAHYPAPDAASGIDAVALEIEEDEIHAFREFESDARSLEEQAGEPPVVRFLNAVFEQAVADGASDIHIEPDEDMMHVRIRVDGLLREGERFPARLHAAVASRVKILANLDISEKRRAQDGRFETPVHGRAVEARVSTFPTVFGENVVIRLLDKTAGPVDIPDLGMEPDVTRSFEDLIRKPHGILLVTGPTGSGKTTTLFGVLNALNSVEKNIITIEDPVEYRLPLVRHCQVNPKAGVTFASGLRSILRQDPDVIMVGEIRDAETAEVAFQAALTGHLVLSTLHTNDAAGGLTRLVDMHVEPFLIGSSVIAILAQRLVRRVCPDCTESFTPPESVLERLGVPSEARFVHGKGCKRCGDSGYRGRLGVFELLPLDSAVRTLVMDQRTSEEIKTHAVKAGMKTLRQDALTKALAGLTTAEEVLRVT